MNSVAFHASAAAATETKAPSPFGPVARADRAPLGRLAVASLHAELVCAPKPGLVTPFDTGSHDDMDAATFMRSMFSLRSYFASIAEAGEANAAFPRLQRLGIDAEAAMLRATGGINTHRGAIFNLGLLVAAASSLRARGVCPSADAVCEQVRERWGSEILAARAPTASSHGQRAARRYGVGGARQQAADGFPSLRSIAVPALRRLLADGVPMNAAMVQALMTLVATIDDTNLLHRGGRSGLEFAQRRAREFLAADGVAAPCWQRHLADIGRDFVIRRLSPGGSADLLACAWFLVRLECASR
jgi:triphosphoribosyl-dephospho-CoA synthase